MHKALSSVPGNSLAEQAGEASQLSGVCVFLDVSVCVCVHVYMHVYFTCFTFGMYVHDMCAW